MNEQMIKIILSGTLGKIFGKNHQRAVLTTNEAIKALCCTIKDFERYLNKSKARGITYAVFRGKENLSLDDLSYPITTETIRIVPVIIGSKKAGLFQTIVGAALIAAAFASSFTPFAAASPFLYAMGASMALGGVIQLLSPQASGLASKQDSANQASYAFGGVTNTASQGYPVPLGYGRRRVGGAIISAGIYVEDQQ